jgi:hypothetical protein
MFYRWRRAAISLDLQMNLSRDHHSQNGEGGPEEAAQYIKGAVTELSRMARRHGHSVLAYLLDMALLEAEEILNGGSRRSGG